MKARHRDLTWGRRRPAVYHRQRVRKAPQSLKQSLDFVGRAIVQRAKEGLLTVPQLVGANQSASACAFGNPGAWGRRRGRSLP